MKRKIIIIACSLLLATALAFSVIPVAAGGLHRTAAPISTSVIEAKIVNVQNEARVDALMAKAVAGGRITAAQATEIKAYLDSQSHHRQTDLGCRNRG